MRIVNRQQFLAMPVGTVYQMFSEENRSTYDSLDVKGRTLENDWYYTSLTSELIVKSRSSSDADAKLEAMVTEGVEHPYAVWSARDGSFDDGDLFLIYDTEAIRQLIDRLQQTLIPQEP